MAFKTQLYSNTSNVLWACVFLAVLLSVIWFFGSLLLTLAIIVPIFAALFPLVVIYTAITEIFYYNKPSNIAYRAPSQTFSIWNDDYPKNAAS